MKIIKKSATPEQYGSNSSGNIAPDTTNVVEFPISVALGEIASDQPHIESDQPHIEKNEQKNKRGKITKSNKALKRGRPCTHGLSGTTTYRSWASARDRCSNPNNRQFGDYGGRGIECRITVEELVEAIGLRPEGRTLDRIDSNGHYAPGNIQWATPKQQAQNRRPPEHYREQAVSRIRERHRDWLDKTQFWNLSLKGINQGGWLPEMEHKELQRLANGLNIPRASFEPGEYFDYAWPVKGEVELPSITRPGQSVTVTAGPCRFQHATPYDGRGVLLSLVYAPPRCNYTAAEQAVFNSFIDRWRTGLSAGLCYTTSGCEESRAQTWPAPREVPLMAFTARMLSNKNDARLVPMADLSEQLAWDDWGHLLTRVLVVPDFHVHGPKGFGIPPWRLEALRELLRVRMDRRLLTIISADDPWQLDPEVGEIVDRHFMLARPEDVQ